jgi:hypothetical protein
MLFSPLSALASTPADHYATHNGTVFYDPNDGGAACAAGGVGNLPDTVPAPYNAIFTAAAQATGVDPALLATIFYTENRGFPDPPPPYGHGRPWPTSPAGAQGPFQFLPSTWTSYSHGGNILDLKDAAAGAGRYLVTLGGKNGAPLGDANNPRGVNPSIILAMASYNAGPAGNFNNPETQQYIQIGVNIYNKLKGTGPTPTGATSTCGAVLGDIVAVAKSQIGTRESPDGCNCGGGIQANGRTVDSYTQDNPEFWCADFVSWVYWKAGHPFTGGAGPAWRIPSAIGIVNWMKANGVWIPNGPGANPQPGMIVYFSHNHTGATGGANDHIGIVESAQGNTLTTIEGNSGNQVQENTYTSFRQDAEIVGFGGLK